MTSSNKKTKTKKELIAKDVSYPYAIGVVLLIPMIFLALISIFTIISNMDTVIRFKNLSLRYSSAVAVLIMVFYVGPSLATSVYIVKHIKSTFSKSSSALEITLMFSGFFYLIANIFIIYFFARNDYDGYSSMSVFMSLLYPLVMYFNAWLIAQIFKLTKRHIYALIIIQFLIAIVILLIYVINGISYDGYLLAAFMWCIFILSPLAYFSLVANYLSTKYEQK